MKMRKPTRSAYERIAPMSISIVVEVLAPSAPSTKEEAKTAPKNTPGFHLYTLLPTAITEPMTWA
eukprot:11393907-Alexandrium_andersonii.AAC.1